MNFYLTKEEHAKLPKKPYWCGTFAGGYWGCCRLHTYIMFTIWSAVIFMLGGHFL